MLGRFDPAHYVREKSLEDKLGQNDPAYKSLRRIVRSAPAKSKVPGPYTLLPFRIQTQLFGDFSIDSH